MYVRLPGTLGIGRWPRTLHSGVRKGRTGLGIGEFETPNPNRFSVFVFVFRVAF